MKSWFVTKTAVPLTLSENHENRKSGTDNEVYLKLWDELPKPAIPSTISVQIQSKTKSLLRDRENLRHEKRAVGEENILSYTLQIGSTKLSEFITECM